MPMGSTESLKIDQTNTKSLAFSKFKELDKQIANSSNANNVLPSSPLSKNNFQIKQKPAASAIAPSLQSKDTVVEEKTATAASNLFLNNPKKLDINAMAAAAQSEAASYTLNASSQAKEQVQQLNATTTAAINTPEPQAAIVSDSVVSSAFAKFRQIGGDTAHASQAIIANAKTESVPPAVLPKASLEALNKSKSDLKTAAVPSDLSTSGPNAQLRAAASHLQSIVNSKDDETSANTSQLVPNKSATEEELFNSKAKLFEKFQKMDASNSRQKQQTILKPPAPAKPVEAALKIVDEPTVKAPLAESESDSLLDADQQDSVEPLEKNEEKQNQSCKQISNKDTQNVDIIESVVEQQRLEVLNDSHTNETQPESTESALQQSAAQGPVETQALKEPESNNDTLVQKRRKTLEASNIPFQSPTSKRFSTDEYLLKSESDCNSEPASEYPTVTRKMSTKTNMNMLATILLASQNNSGTELPAKAVSLEPKPQANQALNAPETSSPPVAILSTEPLLSPLQPKSALPSSTSDEPKMDNSAPPASPTKSKKSAKESMGRTALKMATSIARKILLPKKELVVISASNLSLVTASQASLNKTEPKSIPQEKEVEAATRVAPFALTESQIANDVALTRQQEQSLAELEEQLQDSQGRVALDSIAESSMTQRQDQQDFYKTMQSSFKNASAALVDSTVKVSDVSETQKSESQNNETQSNENQNDENVSEIDVETPTRHQRQQSVIESLRQQISASSSQSPYLMVKQDSDVLAPDSSATLGTSISATKPKRSDSNIMRPCLPEAVNSDLIAKMQARMNHSIDK